MAQNWTATVAGTDSMRSTVKTALPGNDEALRTLHSGATAPANPVAYMLWQDTTTNVLWQRNAGNSAWRPCRRREVRFGDVALSARTWRAVPRASVPILVESVALVTGTTTSASVAASKEWTWTLTNQTAGLGLFSAVPSTATVVGGVGGGEITANTPYVLTANQNQSLAAGAELRLVVGSVGAPTAVADVAFVVSYYELAA